MKLLIVDDERHVRKAIKFLIDATKMHITDIWEASGVQEAVSILHEKRPDVIITDVVMDDFTGIDLMEYVKSTGLSSKIIVVSGYNEYAYMRAALQNGGVDYLLKPIDADQLNAALESAASMLDSDRQTHLKDLQLLDNMCDICKESLLYKLLTQPRRGKDYEDILSLVPDLADEHFAMLGYSSAKYLNCQDFLELEKKTDKLLADLKGGFCFSPPDTDCEFYIFIYKNHRQAQAGIQKLLETRRETGKVPISIGMSELSPFPDKAQALKAQAEQAFLSQDILTPSGSFISYSHKTACPVLISLNREYNQLFSALITGNELFIQSSVQILIKKAFPKSGCTLQYLMEFTQDYNNTMKQWHRQLNEYYPHIHLAECPPLQCGQLPDLNICIQNSIKHFLCQLAEKSDHRGNNVIYQVSHYLENNYMQPFNQSECAKLFFINKDYMCRKFKSTFHVSMVSFITRLRLNKAKELLVSSDMKIQSIAEAVGFEDEKYFSRRFSKETGISPNEYRMKYAHTAK